MGHDKEDAGSKSKMPKDTPLRQQKLKAWQPMPTMYTVVPFTFFIAIVFIPLGAVLIKEADDVKEFVIDYTDCGYNPICEKTIFLEDDFKGDVYFFYQLDNYYQNIRRYQKSLSGFQLIGSNIYDVTDCGIYSRENENDPTSKVIYPCGAMANSMFSDKFNLVFKYRDQPNVGWPSIDINVPWTYEGLLKDRDTLKLYKNPPFTTSLCDALINTVKPKKWTVEPCKLDVTNPQNNGVQNVDFIIWMTAAGLNNFRKPYRKLIRNTPQLASGLPRGEYVLTITNTYDVLSFNGSKKFVITTTSWIGGKNYFFGIAFLTVAGLCIIVGSFLLLVHNKFGHSLGEIGDLSDMQ
uniref:Cell cycle control protein 50A n=1 Tax=Parastrongyloides trichosuri TaxID=131310 RepID=A0A0N4Z580_PARTI